MTNVLALPLNDRSLVIDDRVLARLRPGQQGDLLAASRVALTLGYRYLCWLYLMELEVTQ